MKKAIISAMAAYLIPILYVMAKDIREIQTIDMSQRNQITSTGSGGGGGGSGDISSTATNNFYNTNFFVSPISIGTNGVIPASTILYLQGKTTDDYIRYRLKGFGGGLDFKSEDDTRQLTFDIDGVNLYGRSRISGLSQMYFSSTSGTTYKFEPLVGNTMLSIGTGGVTIGLDSSSAHTINGSTMTIAHPLSINSGQFIFAPSSTGTITNGLGGLTSLGTITASNLTSQVPPDLIARRSPGTGVTNLVDGNGTFRMETRYLFDDLTNNVNGSSFAVNAFHTNGTARRVMANISVIVPSGANAFIWTEGKALKHGFFHNGATVVVTNFVTGYIQPNERFIISNNLGTTPTIRQDDSHLYLQ